MTTIPDTTAVNLVEMHQRVGLATRRLVAGVLVQTCRLSYGDVSVAEYCSHRILDTFIHGWDIARATDQDVTLDPDLVDLALAMFEPDAAELQATGAFGTPVRVPANADTQTKLLAMLGRDNRR